MYTPDIAERITSYTKQQSTSSRIRLSALSLSLLSVITELQDKHVSGTFRTDADDPKLLNLYCVECTGLTGSIITYPCPTITGIVEGLKNV
jgi:hypothetical protein